MHMRTCTTPSTTVTATGTTTATTSTTTLAYRPEPVTATRTATGVSCTRIRTGPISTTGTSTRPSLPATSGSTCHRPAPLDPPPSPGPCGERGAQICGSLPADPRPRYLA